MKESSFKNESGLNIFRRSWHPTGQPVRGVVVIVPGFNSHSGYYEWTANQLVSHGLAVYALDLRGRGKSDGERFFVEQFEDYVSDVSSFISIVKKQEPGLPLYLLAHSAGGVVAVNYTL